MYVMLQRGLQPRRLLNITHILFRCGAMDGGTPGLRVFILEESFFDDHIYFTLRERLRSFFQKLRSFINSAIWR